MDPKEAEDLPILDQIFLKFRFKVNRWDREKFNRWLDYIDLPAYKEEFKKQGING
jgi:hypothetical protein